jgi:hypothetical protein
MTILDDDEDVLIFGSIRCFTDAAKPESGPVPKTNMRSDRIIR